MILMLFSYLNAKGVTFENCTHNLYILLKQAKYIPISLSLSKIMIKLCSFYCKKLGPNIYKLISVQQFDNDTFINSHFQLIITPFFHSKLITQQCKHILYWIPSLLCPLFIHKIYISLTLSTELDKDNMLLLI